MSLDRSKLRWNGWGWTARKDEAATREAFWIWLASELGMPALLATPPRPLEGLQLPPTKLTLQDRVDLASIVGESQLRDSPEERAFHARGKSYRDLLLLRSGDLSSAPDAVLYPRGSNEVLGVLATAAARDIGVVPFGGGSGAVTPERGDFNAVITLDLSDMDRVIAIDTTSQTVTVEAGIYGPVLETALKTKGLTLGWMPTDFEFTTVGGWIASGAADDITLNAQLATPSGSIDQAAKVACGSKGKLGVINQATLRAKPAPRVTRSATYLFADFARGLATLRAAAQEGCGAAQFHLADVETTRLVSGYNALERSAGLWDGLKNRYFRWRNVDQTPCALTVFFDGTRETTAFEKRRAAGIAARYGGVGIGGAASQSLRQSRFQALYLRDSLIDRGVGVETFAVTTPWSNVQAAYDSVKTALTLVLRETAPHEDAHGLVLCHISKAATEGPQLSFTAIFPRAIGTDLAQWETIEAAALSAIQTSGAKLVPEEDETRHRKLRAPDELAPDATIALKKILDPKGVLRPEKTAN